jgi:hypothetical protein
VASDPAPVVQKVDRADGGRRLGVADARHHQIARAVRPPRVAAALVIAALLGQAPVRPAQDIRRLVPPPPLGT